MAIMAGKLDDNSSAPERRDLMLRDAQTQERKKRIQGTSCGVVSKGILKA